MSLQILGGMAKGFKLLVPETDLVRPTSVMLRRRIFDSHQDCSGEIFVDLFAGSGAVGFEAASRGADKVIFCESNPKCQKIIKQNLQAIKSKMIDCEMAIFPVDASQFIKNIDELVDQNSIIFIDPPYDKHELYFMILEALRKIDYKGSLWIESDVQKGPKESLLLEHLSSEMKIYRQGTHFVIMANLN